MRQFVKCKIVPAALLAALILGGTARLLLRTPGLETMGTSRFAGGPVVIDPGHGGEDGGAVSARGTVESQINLAIALRLDAILSLYGVETLPLRETDISLHSPDAKTLRQKKVSDLHNRVEKIEGVQNATLISIHENIYPGVSYHGAQVFYANDAASRPLAVLTQETLRTALDANNQRQPAIIPTSIYLMNHISCRAILVECGFLSNPEEDAKLCTPVYQAKLATALAGSYLKFQQLSREGEIPNVTEG